MSNNRNYLIHHVCPSPDEALRIRRAETSLIIAILWSAALESCELLISTAVVSAGLILLQRLKAHFPSAKGPSGHRLRLFISAYMIASKVICDDTYLNESWMTATLS